MYQKKIYLGFLVIATLLGFSACGTSNPAEQTTTSKQERAYTSIHVYIRHLEMNNLTRLEAQFLEGDSLGIAYDGQVYFDAEATRSLKLPEIGYRYEREIVGPVQENHVLTSVGKDTEGTERHVEVAMYPIVNWRVDGGHISQSKAGAILWDNAPFTDNDLLIIRITDASGKTYTINHVGITNGSRFIFEPIHLEAMQTGEAEISLVRKHTEVAKTDDGVKTLTITEYYSTEQSIQILE